MRLKLGTGELTVSPFLVPENERDLITFTSEG